MLVSFQKAVAAYLAWSGLLCGAIVLILVPPRISLFQPGNFLACLVQVQLFFVVLLWPLFLPALIRDGIRATVLLAQGAGLTVLALPLLLPAVNISNAGLGGVVAGQSLVLGWAVLACGLWAIGQARKRTVGPGYFLGAFLLSALLPFWGFLSREFGGSGMGGLAWVSPFWAAATGSGAAMGIQAALAGATGLALLVLAARPGRVDAPPVSG